MRSVLKRNTGLLAAAVISLSFTAPASWAQSLTDTMIAAYNSSGLIDQNRALLRATDEDVAQAVASLRPILSWAAGSTYADPARGDDINSAVTLSAEVLLFDFGRSQLSIDAAKETVLATRELLKSVEQDVLLRAVTAFFNVRRETAFLGLRENNVRLITQQLRAARDRFEVGEVTRTDVSIAEARLAAARSGLAAAQGSLARAIEEYRSVTGNTPRQLQSPPAPPATAANLPAAKAVASDRHPDVLRAQRDVTVAELAILISRGAMRPRLTGNAGFTVDDDGDDETTIGLAIGGPIYQGGAITSAVRQAQARRDASRGALLTTQRTVEQNVGNAWANLSVASASVQASEQEVRAARLALRGAREEFDVGARTTLDVLDLEQELLDAETSRVSAQIDRNLAVYQLLSSMGLLTVEHLGLGIATYDPAAYYKAVEGAPTSFVSPQGKKLDRVLRRIGQN
ncbi:MAG: TolC family outer membrane protein [Rhodobacteraceae bacterium]|nr:TolC family outer membrane protein [Alphaproteobacteria bacterium]NNK65928.1 TolC family outer membrane protein [Paracoccaceae bacterium]